MVLKFTRKVGSCSGIGLECTVDAYLQLTRNSHLFIYKTLLDQAHDQCTVYVYTRCPKKGNRFDQG